MPASFQHCDRRPPRRRPRALEVIVAAPALVIAARVIIADNDAARYATRAALDAVHA